MPIHDQSYRRYTGAREGPGSAWAVIASTGLRSLVRKKFFMAVMVFSWLQFVVRSVLFYLSANFPQMEVIAPSPETFRSFFEQQGIFVLFVAVYVGAGLIATDRRVHALQIYLSKPLTRMEYIMGKLAILVSLLLLVTWVPAMLLLVVQVLFAGDLEFFRANLFLVPAITIFGVLYAVVVSFAMLALSSLSTSARFVGVLYVGVLLFTSALATVMNLVTGGTSLSWLSFRANLAQLGDVIFGMSPRYENSWGLSMTVILAVILVSALVLDRRVRGVEVVT